MAKRCFSCGKKARTGHSISHSNIKTKRKWLANLQNIKIKVGGKIKRVNVCTKCLKKGKVKKAV